MIFWTLKIDENLTEKFSRSVLERESFMSQKTLKSVNAGIKPSNFWQITHGYEFKNIQFSMNPKFFFI